MSLEVSVGSDLDEVRDEWADLDACSEELFTSWSWQAAWWRHCAAAPPLLVQLRAGGRLVGVFPLHLARARGLRVLRTAGYGPGDRLGVACAPADRPALVAALPRALEHVRDWDVFLAGPVPVSQGWTTALGRAALTGEACPEIRGYGGRSSDYLRSRSKKLRSHVQRATRQLLAVDGTSFRLADDPDRLPRDLDALLGLHRARWGGETPFTRDEAFHRAYSEQALARGQLRLWVLERKGQALAALLGYRFGGAEWYYQSGRDPSLRAESLGSVMVLHSVMSALDDGVETYHLLRGDEGYKRRFATHDDGVETVAVPRSARGRGALLAARAALALPPDARRAVRRLLPRSVG